MLAAEGLLDYVPNRGYIARSVDLAGLTSIFDIRGVLEGLAARLETERERQPASARRTDSAMAASSSGAGTWRSTMRMPCWARRSDK